MGKDVRQGVVSFLSVWDAISIIQKLHPCPDERLLAQRHRPITGIGDGGRDRTYGGYRAYMEIRREQAKISDYCGFDSRIPRYYL